MPYKSFKRGERWCVYKLDANDNPTGKTLGCHPSKPKADKQVAALWASEGNMEKADIEQLMVLIKEAVKEGIEKANSGNAVEDTTEDAVEDAVDNIVEDAVEETVEEPIADVAKGDELEFDIDVIEKSTKKQITYSVVYEPYVIDSQGDFADMEEIESMAHNYLKNHLVSIRPAADLNHKKELELEDAIPVESYIAPADFEMGEQTIKKGSWVLAMHIPNPEIWEMVEKGEITGYSLRGRGLRIPASIE